MSTAAAIEWQTAACGRRSSRNLSREGSLQRPGAHEIRRDLRDVQRDHVVVVGIADVEPRDAAHEPEGHAGWRTERVAVGRDVLDDPVWPDSADASVIEVGDEQGDPARRIGHHGYAR